MLMRSVIPSPAVAAYVSSILVIEHTDPLSPFLLPLIANGYPCIAFHTADSPIATANGERTGSLMLYGQFIEPDALQAQGRFTIIALFLYPAMLKTLFGESAKQFTGNSINLGDEQPAKGLRLTEQLLNQRALDDRLQLLTNYVGELAARTRKEADQTIVYATEAIRRSNGLLPLKSLQQELFITERTFQRLFESYVGVSPKLFSRICQFDTAFQQLNLHRPNRLIDVAHKTGYADESHFIRAFKEFTHYTPSEYLALSAPFIS